MTQSRWIFWHRRDLRIYDNLGLSESRKRTNAITGVFVFDERIFPKNSKKSLISSSQNWFLTKSLEELRKKWIEIGSELIIMHGNPVKLIPHFAEIINAEFVAWNNDVEPQMILQDQQISTELKKKSIKIFSCWDHILINPNELRTIQGQTYKVYGPFWNNWKQKVGQKASTMSALEGGLKPTESPSDLLVLKAKEKNKLKNIIGNKYISNPSLKIEEIEQKNIFKGIKLCPCKPGELAGKEQLSYFINSKKIFSYKKNRDLPYINGTSKLSAALRLGTVSPRQVWQASEEALNLSETPSEIESVITWQKELCWREFYQNALFNYPRIAEGPYREKWKDFPWENNINMLSAWKQGNTGIPIIDAAIRELIHTGWMHNRCRMIVASFLVKDLLCNWQHGEKFFMENLVDGDLAANNGGWQWSSSCGLDTKPLRIFNPFAQAKKFDKDAKYIKKWIPELSHVSSKDLITGSINSLERKSYPEPIISHKIQQAKFKKIYKLITGSLK